MKRPAPILLAFGVVAALAPFRAAAQQAAVAPAANAPVSLAANSPFLPAGSANGSANADTPLELRGIMWTAQGLKYCIYNPASKASAWSAVNEPGHDFLVKSADPAHETVVVEGAGMTLNLALRDEKVTPLAPTAPAIGGQPISAPPGVSPPSGTPQNLAATMQAIAAEVQRRRMLRQQAALLNGPPQSQTAPPGNR